MFGFILITTTLFSNSTRGHNYYFQNLQYVCGISTASFARKHTQDEWEAIYGAGKFRNELHKICPKAKIETKYVSDIYHFVYEYAKDSGKLPTY
ncbi:MAG: cytochrome C [Sulfurovum sp.]